MFRCVFCSNSFVFEWICAWIEIRFALFNLKQMCVSLISKQCLGVLTHSTHTHIPELYRRNENQNENDIIYISMAIGGLGWAYKMHADFAQSSNVWQRRASLLNVNVNKNHFSIRWMIMSNALMKILIFNRIAMHVFVCVRIKNANFKHLDLYCIIMFVAWLCARASERASEHCSKNPCWACLPL